jgi:hypothetical protein
MAKGLGFPFLAGLGWGEFSYSLEAREISDLDGREDDEGAGF